MLILYFGTIYVPRFGSFHSAGYSDDVRQTASHLPICSGFQIASGCGGNFWGNAQNVSEDFAWDGLPESWDADQIP